MNPGPSLFLLYSTVINFVTILSIFFFLQFISIVLLEIVINIALALAMWRIHFPSLYKIVFTNGLFINCSCSLYQYILLFLLFSIKKYFKTFVFTFRKFIRCSSYITIVARCSYEVPIQINAASIVDFDNAKINSLFNFVGYVLC